MKFSSFARCLRELESTASRKEMVGILAELLKRSSEEEVGKICYLCLGRLAPVYRSVEFNVAEKTMLKVLSFSFGVREDEVRSRYKKLGDLGSVAELLRGEYRGAGRGGDLEVAEVYNELLRIARDSGAGSQERKVHSLAALLRKLSPLGVRYCARIPLGQLRLGFSDVTLIEALAVMVGGGKEEVKFIRQKFNIRPDVGEIVRVIKLHGLEGLKEVGVEIGTPILPALAERMPTMEKIVEKLGEFAVEPKMDGIRLQIHLNKAVNGQPLVDSLESQRELFNEQGSKKESPGALVCIFSRRLDDVTDMFPDVVAAVQKLPVDSAIMDGEAIAYNPDTEEFLPFQETMKRKRKYNVAQKAAELPLKVFLFDLLFLNGKSLLETAFGERRRLLEKLVLDGNLLMAARHTKVNSARKLKKLFDLYISEGLEGVMCKRLDSPYQAGARNFNWVKYKRSAEGVGLPDTVDGLVMGYYAGRGQRAKFGVGAFLAGVFNPQKDRFETIAKVGTGLTDDQWREFSRRVGPLEVKAKPAEYCVAKELECDAWLRPGLVVEIDADEVTCSPVHTAARGLNIVRTGAENGAGLSLRFPRLVRFRDKLPEEATTVEEIMEMYRMQQT